MLLAVCALTCTRNKIKSFVYLIDYFSKLHNKPEEYLEFQKKRATNTLRECFEAIGKENRIRTEGVSFEEFELIRQKTMGSGKM